jgi:hypothetical protein
MTTYSANTVARTRKPWADLIRADLQKSAEGFITAGLHLIEAKSDLEGAFLEMLETELHLSPDKAEMLMKIARKFGHLTDSADLRNLPASRTTLFEMTKLDMKVLEAKLKDGTFNADTERKDVIKLLPKPKKAKPRKAKVITPTEEITGAPEPKPAPKPMPAWERLRLYVRDIRSELVKELMDDPDAGRQYDQDMAAIRAKAGGKATTAPAITQPVAADDDAEVAAIFQAATEKPLSCDRPPPTPAPGPIQEMSAESIVPEDADDDLPEMPEFLRRKEEIRDGLLQRMPYLKHDPDRLEEMVLDRIR